MGQALKQDLLPMRKTGKHVCAGLARLGLTVAMLVGPVLFGTAQEDADPLKVALVANQAHLDSFPRYKCRYTLTRAEAKNEAAALRGEYKNVRSCEYVLVVDGGKLKFQALSKLKVPSVKDATRDSTGKLGVSVEFIPNCDLTKDNYSLRYTSSFGSARIGTSDPPENDELAPLGISTGERLSGSPANWFLRGRAINPQITGRGEIVMDGTPVVHVRTKAKSIDYEYYFDVARAYMPLKVVCHHEPPWSAKKFDSVRHLMEAKQCTQGRWFPMRWVLLWITPGQAEVDVQEIRVKELDVDTPLTAKDFSVELPAGTSVELEPAKNGDAPLAFQLRQNESVSPEDLPRLVKMLQERPNNPLMDTAIVRPNNHWFTWALFAGGAALFGAAFFIYRIARKGRPRPKAD